MAARIAGFHGSRRFAPLLTMKPNWNGRMQIVGVLGALALCASAPAHADDVAKFYAGKSLHLVIGYAPGGGYDLYARTLARHIAGNPNIVVQNMPGAGSLKAANYLYTIAPKDGTTFGGFSRGAYLDPLLGRGAGAQYVAPKFGWLGSISSEVGVCAFRSGAGIKAWADMRTKPFIVGSTGAGADADVFPTVLRKMFKLPMKIVAGYGSAAEIVIAIKRSEVDGRCGWSWSSLVSWNRDMFEGRQIDVVLQLAARKLDELPDVPLVGEIAERSDHKAVLNLIISRQTMALQRAFDATMKDPAFLADAKRQDLEVLPVSGAEAAVLLKDAYATPPDLVRQAIEFMKD
jgi:tripartite-type tricarboxylate transporter receptor subunit TctC